MAQTRAAVATRYNAPTVTLGGAQERKFRLAAYQVVQVAGDIESLISDSVDSASKTSIMADFDDVIAKLNTACSKLPN